MLPEATRVTKGYQNLPGVTKTYQRLPKAIRSYHKLPGATRSLVWVFGRSCFGGREVLNLLDSLEK